MNIAIAVDGDAMTSPVSECFEECGSLLIVDVDAMSVTTIPNTQALDESAGERLAKIALRHDCEVVITGLIRPAAFELLAGAGVTRYHGIGYGAAQALELMDANGLDLIRDANGGAGCGGSHHH